jgi:Ca2+-binding EF-hand superfamily protein
VQVFQYFASVKVGDEWFMTPRDFVRSITPFNFRGDNADPFADEGQLPAAFARVMAVADPNGDGRISFPEYVFFTSLLSIPRRYFDVAFRIMDRNRDNKVDAEEFQKVMNVIQSHNPIQQAARVPVETGVLLTGWFGPDASKTLSVEQFRSFLNDLHNSVREVYFSSLDSDRDGFIDARAFALSLVNFASVKDLPRLVQRVQNLPGVLEGVKVSLKQFLDWKTILEQIDEVDNALSLFVAGRGNDCTTAQLKRAIQSVTGIVASDEQLAVILAVFDEDGNGMLSRAEFGDVLRKAAAFGLSKPRDLGLVRFVTCCKDCVSNRQ